MGVYARADSTFWWMHLEGTKRKLSTGIPVGHGGARRESRQQAEAIYRAAMGDLARGRFDFKEQKPQITFAAWCDWYRDHVSKLHRAYRREVSMLRGFVKAFPGKHLHEIAEHDLEGWKATRIATHNRHTVNREIDVLKPLFAKAIPLYLEHSPAARLQRFTPRPVPITILSESAEDALLAHASDEERAMILLGLDALLRLGDVRRLRIEHDKGRHLEVIDPKTAPYKVPVSTRLRAALDALTPVGGYYFPRMGRGRTVTPMGETTATELFNTLCARADVLRGRKCSGITFHSLRHTGATRAARVVKLTVVKELGGWNSLKQLGRYDHPDDPEKIKAVEAIGQAQKKIS